jgi:hypothetical protein
LHAHATRVDQRVVQQREGDAIEFEVATCSQSFFDDPIGRQRQIETLLQRAHQRCKAVMHGQRHGEALSFEGCE